MRFAILADIHSNHIALEACLAEARRKQAQEYFFLGDYLGELAYPQRTLEILEDVKRRFPCHFIRGNKEDYWIDRKNGNNLDWSWEAGRSGSGMLAYVYDRLTPRQIEAFERMPIAMKLSYPPLPDFTICHGSPWKTSESLREDYDYIDEKTRLLETELTICAHFHIQSAYTRNGKRVINPGAVGVPLRSAGQAQFMMLYDKNGAWEPEFITLSYDRERAIAEMDEENLSAQAPGWYRATKQILQSGDYAHLKVLTRASQLCKQFTGKDEWKNIPEEYWQMALAELRIPY